MTKPTNGKPAAKTPVMIVFGRFKNSNIDQAAFFTAGDAPAARQAAAHAGLSVIEVKSDPEQKAAASLKEGVANGQGRFSLSPISKAMLTELQRLFEASRANSAAMPSADKAGASSDPWASLKPGDLVLAAGFDEEDNLEGWYPATIVKKDDGEFVVRWRDFPDEPNGSRSPEYLALLHPTMR